MLVTFAFASGFHFVVLDVVYCSWLLFVGNPVAVHLISNSALMSCRSRIRQSLRTVPRTTYHDRDRAHLRREPMYCRGWKPPLHGSRSPIGIQEGMAPMLDGGFLDRASRARKLSEAPPSSAIVRSRRKSKRRNSLLVFSDCQHCIFVML